ncbi:ABC transporter ATP-binding protein [Methanospirillum lacunae]|uniref:ABC transporter ATP-binding protein n=1 Tax=Methanospirillum lacunae TaxID=668570 RepID=A0A2V2N3E3_9EURY|nr:ABC transporter ATP-binding protein [Methanospirillum lacunae]PWR70707.1 ABC transporter ATP-binding protein [Methanospirillum lacunae]
MNDVVIQIKNLSKQYRLGVISHGLLSKDLQSKWARFLGRDDPNTKVNSELLGFKTGSNEQFWALKDISFEVRKGDILGIIGRNGAGKSTLLKILSRVTAPTSGKINVKGRIASLLEVGTGFHPELTGRENIFLNGAILGMTKNEINSKFDEIVSFSGVDKFIDTPVKRYSSGMYVRLAFAVAAHMEPEILVVDEVLAVGDADFQKKCLGKMQEISKGGRTVLFVSHNMPMISSLCNECILLDSGKIKLIGHTSDVIASYQMGNNCVNPATIDYSHVDNPPGDHQGTLCAAWIENRSGEQVFEISINKSFFICMQYKILNDVPKIPSPNFHIYDSQGQCAFITSPSWNYDQSCKSGEYIAKCEIPANFMNDGLYSVHLALTFIHTGMRVSFWEKHALMFNITDPIEGVPSRISGYGGVIPGVIRPSLEWNVDQIG